MVQPVYDQAWHEDYADRASLAARLILAYVISIFPSKSLLELGCGQGAWSRVALDIGVETVFGIDGIWTNRGRLQIPEELFEVRDLSKRLELLRLYDLVLTLEVAEHIESSSATTFVESCVRHAPVVVFGAAIPFQGGYHHVNEQWPSYWRALFDERGYTCFDLIRPTFWQHSEIPYYYRQNAFVFVDRQAKHLIGAAQEAAIRISSQNVPFDAVHPEKYRDMASYDRIYLRRLLRKLPTAIADSLRNRIAKARRA